MAKPLASTGGVVSHEVSFSRSGSKPYLTVTSTVDDANRRVSLAMANDQSHLLLAISAIDLAVSTGTATVTGSYAGSAVNWSGTVDLNSTPWSGQPVPGWPPKAFASELQSAAFFAPLADRTSPRKPIPVTPRPVGPGHIQPKGSALRSVGKGLLWAGATVVGAVLLAPGVPVLSVVVASLAAFDASVGGDAIDKIPEDPIPTPVPPIDEPPLEEDTTVHVTGVSQDDSPPAGQDAGGSTQGAGGSTQDAGGSTQDAGGSTGEGAGGGGGGGGGFDDGGDHTHQEEE